MELPDSSELNDTSRDNHNNNDDEDGQTVIQPSTNSICTSLEIEEGNLTRSLLGIEQNLGKTVNQ